MSEQREAQFWQQAIGDEIARQCGIGAGTCGNAADGSGLFEVNASLDLNEFAAAMQKVTAGYLNDLRPWGYAPGSYVFTCKDCPADIDLYDKMGRLGDKRSIRCEEHARAARDATTPARNGLLDIPSVPPVESLSGVLVQALKRADQGLPLRARDRVRLLEMGLIRKVPDRFSTPTSSGQVVLATIKRATPATSA